MQVDWVEIQQFAGNLFVKIYTYLIFANHPVLKIEGTCGENIPQVLQKRDGCES